MEGSLLLRKLLTLHRKKSNTYKVVPLVALSEKEQYMNTKTYAFVVLALLAGTVALPVAVQASPVNPMKEAARNELREIRKKRRLERRALVQELRNKRAALKQSA